jgi:hypothetical protein
MVFAKRGLIAIGCIAIGYGFATFQYRQAIAEDGRTRLELMATSQLVEANLAKSIDEDIRAARYEVAEAKCLAKIRTGLKSYNMTRQTNTGAKLAAELETYLSTPKR